MCIAKEKKAETKRVGMIQTAKRTGDGVSPVQVGFF